jgi:hypothetical protein
MRVGYGAAALPLWEEFLLRYFTNEACSAAPVQMIMPVL